MNLNTSKSIYYKVAFYFALIFIMFFLVNENKIKSAKSEFYEFFQRESESLVIGKMVAEKYNIKIPNKANLGFATIYDYAYDPKHIIQGYSLINESDIPDIRINIANINDDNWENGVSKKLSSFVLYNPPDLTSYIGREILFNKTEKRQIKSIESFGEYTNVNVTGPLFDPTNLFNEVLFSGKYINNSENIILSPYLSQYGLQGILYSKLNKLYDLNLKTLNSITTFLFCLVIVFLALIFRKIISTDFAVIFILTTIFSPWLISFAKNLYWVSFTWFLPALFSGLFYLSKERKQKIYLIFFIYLSFVIKCLCGYEYISSIILLSVSIYIYELFNPQRYYPQKKIIKYFFLICFVGVIGFFTALLIHAGLRGENIMEGLRNIYSSDVKRRTWGDASIYGESLATPVLSLIYTYIFDWKTSFLKGISGLAFSVLLFINILLFSFNLIRSNNKSNTYLTLGIFISFILPPLSWIIIAKGHSGHIHMNFVLWYFGFASCIVYIPYIQIKLLFKELIFRQQKKN